MKRPDFVDIFGRLVILDFEEGLKDNEEADGDYKDGVIRLDDTLKDEDLICTLIHEMVHALFDRAGLRQGIQDQAEEVCAEQVAIMMIENFKITPR